MNLLEAIQSLDPANDEHWTGQGLPRIDVLAKLADMPFLKRGEVEAFAPGYRREQIAINPVVPVSLEQRRGRARAELEQARREQVSTEQRIVDLCKEIDALTAKIDVESPPPVLASVIQDYQNSELQRRVDHHRQLEEMRAKGVDLSQFISGKAPLDQILSNRRVRGSARPTFPLGGAKS